MENFDVREYNKRCAEFLGQRLISKDDFNMLGENAYTGENKNIKWGIIEYLKFHSNWNWIMEVVEVIENKSRYTIMNTDLYDSFEINRQSIKFYFNPDNKYLLQLELKQFIPEEPWIHTMYKDHIIQQFDFKTNGKKAGVVRAIDIFLIWYNKNINENNKY